MGSNINYYMWANSIYVYTFLIYVNEDDHCIAINPYTNNEKFRVIQVASSSKMAVMRFRRQPVILLIENKYIGTSNIQNYTKMTL